MAIVIAEQSSQHPHSTCSTVTESKLHAICEGKLTHRFRYHQKKQRSHNFSHYRACQDFWRRFSRAPKLQCC